MTYIKENIITKLQKLYSPPSNPREGNKLPALFLKKPLCTGNLSPARKIFIETSWFLVGYQVPPKNAKFPHIRFSPPSQKF